jgi:hypothetical protein
MSTYTDHGKTTSAKRNSGRKSALAEKRSSYIERDCFEKSQNYNSTGNGTAGLNIHLEDPVSTKLSNVSFTNPTSTV